jgi:hypothetical protein
MDQCKLNRVVFLDVRKAFFYSIVAENLRWDKHIEKNILKVDGSGIAILRRATHFIPVATLQNTDLHCPDSVLFLSLLSTMGQLWQTTT